MKTMEACTGGGKARSSFWELGLQPGRLARKNKVC
jgi:hypothetical protein